MDGAAEGWGVLVGNISDDTGMTLQQLEVYVTNIVTKDSHMVKTYGPGPVNHDPYYDENLVLSDLPAGFTRSTSTMKARSQQDWMCIYPGQVTYFTYSRHTRALTLAPPPTPTFFCLHHTPRLESFSRYSLDALNICAILCLHFTTAANLLSNLIRTSCFSTPCFGKITGKMYYSNLFFFTLQISIYT